MKLNVDLPARRRGIGRALVDKMERWVKADSRTLLLMAPGWVRTDMGGPQARLSIEESIPNLLDTMEAYEGRTGLHYLDYLGRVVPW